MDEPVCRKLTREECRDKFLSHIAGIVDYWYRESRTPHTLAKMEGLVHSLLVTLDGCSGDMPAFLIAPHPHPDDKEYCIDNGYEFYWPQNHEAELDSEIGGGLHEQWHKYCKYKYTEEDLKALGCDSD